MEEGKLLRILSDWNFWGSRAPDVGVGRDVYTDRISDLLKDGNKVVAEVGIRRCGKSFIAKQVAARFIEDGLGKEDVLIINLDDERLVEKNYGLLLAAYELYKRELRPKRRPLIVLDEAQEVPGWERFVRGLSERDDASFVVTGSSSALLSSEYSTLLSGRHIIVNVSPLGFSEFLEFNGVHARSRLDLAASSGEVDALLEDYLQYGGFPAVVRARNKEDLLVSYFDTILIKDVAGRYKIRDQEKLRFLAKFYLTNISSTVTYNSISRSTRSGGGKGMPVKTVQRFSEYLGSSLLLFFVKRFSFSVKEQENSPRKVYSIDNGFSTVLGFSFMEIKGRLMENAIAIELLRRSHSGKPTEIFYWKSKTSGREVDFLVKAGKTLRAIQAAYKMDSQETEGRELDALIECMQDLGLKEGTIITYDKKGKETVKGFRINYVDLRSWLLGNADALE